MFVDQASYHTTDHHSIPENMILFPLLAHSPELNHVEVLWNYIRSNYFKNEWFQNSKDVSDRLLLAFRELVSLPDVIKSLAGWKWIVDSFVLEQYNESYGDYYIQIKGDDYTQGLIPTVFATLYCTENQGKKNETMYGPMIVTSGINLTAQALDEYIVELAKLECIAYAMCGRR